MIGVRASVAQRIAVTHLLLFLLLSIPLLSLVIGCTRSTNDSPSDPYAHLFDGVTYVGSKKCAPCHADLYEAFSQSEMGRSMSVIDSATMIERFPQREQIHDSTRNFLYEMYKENGKYYQREYRVDRAGNKIYERSEKAEFIIGSGNNLRMYFRTENGMLYQLPLTWYTHSKNWDLSPGFREFNNLRFRRFASVRCLMCHNSLMQERPASNDRYDQPFPLGIGCERCHGPGEKHIRQMTGRQAGTKEITIVNPKKLPHQQQLDVCQQCHLQAKSWAPHNDESVVNFRPGQRLATNRSLYFPEKTDKEVFEVADSPHRMKLSRCYTESDSAMTCLTCHDPHYSIKTFPTAYFNQKCLSCHRAESVSAIKGAYKHSPVDNCVRCHMNKTGTNNTLHGVSVTDHWIRVDANKTVINWSLLRRGPEHRPLIALVPDVDADDDARPIRKGIAYLEYYKDHDRRLAYLDSAAANLQKNPEQLRMSSTGLFALGQVEAIRGNLQSSVEFHERAISLTPKFAEGYWHLANVYLSLGQFENAEKHYRKAIELKPEEPQYLESLGVLLAESERPGDAVQVLEEAIRIDAQNPDAYYHLGNIYARDFRDAPKALPYFERLVLLDPNYENAYLSLGAAYISAKRYRDGIATLKKEIELKPGSAAAFFNLGRAYLELKDTLQSDGAFRRAVELDPTMDISKQ
jgi:tetratricopeptide (TPR) repeat protein